jgi:hypothetical protein
MEVASNTDDDSDKEGSKRRKWYWKYFRIEVLSTKWERDRGIKKRAVVAENRLYTR